MIRTAIFAVVMASPAAAVDFEFCWIGSNGYVLEGRMSLPFSAFDGTVATQDDVTAFAIFGTHNGVPIGAWDMQDITPQTSWNLNFDTQTMEFVTGGYSTSNQGQQWNASGAVNDCGAGGFGFNAGAGGQDVCVNNTYITDSIIDAETLLSVYPVGMGPTCGAGEPLLGSGLPPLTTNELG